MHSTSEPEVSYDVVPNPLHLVQEESNGGIVAKPTPEPHANGVNGSNGVKGVNGINGINGVSDTMSFKDTPQSLKWLYSKSAVAKIWNVAQRSFDLAEPPHLFPEYTKTGQGHYVYRNKDFWTSGFFPGCLHLILERQRKYRSPLQPPSGSKDLPHTLQLEFACNWWTENLHQNATLLGTHDLGFMIAPWARLRWELNHDRRSFDTILSASKTLADRFSDKVGAIRSWDRCVTKIYRYDETSDHFLVIIDNMMNLDMLFWAAANHPSSTEARRFYDTAVRHAQTSQKHHVAKDFSTVHVVEFDPASGDIRRKITNQGYSNTSCWARGQAWAIAGFAQTAMWTGSASFLETAEGCARFFLSKLPSSGSVPPWDFDAPLIEDDGKDRPTDTSAGLVAAYGMLLIHEIHTRRGEGSPFLKAALELVDAICQHNLNAPAAFAQREQSVDVVEPEELQCAGRHFDVKNLEGDTIVNGATINNFKHAPRRWANHGLVYADYYFLLLGNKLLDLGLGQHIMSH